ncbi:MAG: peptidylprolyl isomerase [Planctomycetota bacterium]|jgi:parvulin-like peptidyl-prolyl isomerase
MALTVNGEKIEDSAIQQEAERLRSDYERVFADQDPKGREAQLLEWSRENVIERVLINQQARKTGKPISEAELEAALAKVKEQYHAQGQVPEEISIEDQAKLKKDVELQMKVEQLLADICKDTPEPSKADVLKFYNENKEQLKSAEQIRVSHIVKHINWQTDQAAAHDAIKKAQNELRQGALFETLAAKYSDCPENGGDLGYITRGQMVEEFEDVVFNLGVGEASDVFRTRFGFHIAKVYDRKAAVVPALEEVKNRIVGELKEQVRRKTIEDFIDRLKNEAKIEEV